VVAKPGQRIEIAYAASGTDGYVRLLGTDGAIWAEAPFSHGGSTQFTVPNLPGQRELRVLLHVTRGRSTAESSAGLIVGSAQPDPNAQPTPAVAGDNQMDSAADGYANGTFQVASPTVPSGGTIHVQIISPRNGMRLSLTDTQSNEVTAVDVGTDQQTVSLRAPQVRVATRYTVVASFTDGFGQESIVQPVTVTP
jgi:FtsP/CotA-like multicopper oxidase with cupredoxin domain